MKLIDKFLKKLNINRNTFATYILTLLTVYLAVDRLVEMLFMIFTGVSYSYWGPIQYTLALACPIFAFLFSGQSEFATSNMKKVAIFYVYVIGLYIIALSMFTQWLNMGAWLFLLSTPNYVDLITDFSDIVKPAFISISLYLPLVTIFPVFKWLYMGINDNLDQIRSIWDYKGISLSDPKKDRGVYTCEVFLCTDHDYGTVITIPEVSRYLSLFVCGGSGTGKTSLVFEPMIARDIEKKYFFREVSKEMGFTALKTGIAHLKRPYDNDYLNKNFKLEMLTPADGKEAVYNTYMKKMILGTLNGENVYKNLGLEIMSPDYELIDHMTQVCDNYGFKYKMIDPSNSNSMGLNPFIYDDPSKIAVTISSALKAMYNNAHEEVEDAYREDFIIQAIENLAIILKEMYPRMNEGALPNMEDMLKMFTNFELIEKMCEILAHDEELKEKYSIQLSYFKKCFYKNGPAREQTEKDIYAAVTQLDNLLRLPGVKSVLCNRFNNIDFDKALADGEITFVCTRRGDLGSSTHQAFGLFFLISMQNAVLRRPGGENSRVPNFLYVDEFPDFICKATEAIFTMYRKYRVGTIISAQNLAQLETPKSRENYRNTILSNCANKVFTGNAVIDELEWWVSEFGQHREWTYKVDFDTEKTQYGSKYGDAKWAYVNYFTPGKLQTMLTDKLCAFKVKDIGGKPLVGPGRFNYLESKYKEKQKIKTFDFGKYSDGVTTATEDDTSPKKKFDLKNLDFTDERDEINPVQTDTTDSRYLFDNDDAVVINFKRNEKK